MERRTFLSTAPAALVVAAMAVVDRPGTDRLARTAVAHRGTLCAGRTRRPGGTSDRRQAHHEFGQSFVIENKPGANGAIGVQMLIAAPADGYTLLMHGSAGVTIYPAVMKQPAFDPLRDLTPITLVDYFDLILCVNPELPMKDVKEFVAYAKANPGKLSYGTAGVGAMNHVGTEWFKTMTGIDIVHVPYRGDAPSGRPM